MAIDVGKQVAYWKAGATEALGSAELLIANARWGFGLFLLHLSLEKLLKALTVEATGQVAPRTHDLLWLARRASLSPPEAILVTFGELQAYCLAGRYPDAEPAGIDRTLAQRELGRAREAYLWLQSQFKK